MTIKQIRQLSPKKNIFLLHFSHLILNKKKVFIILIFYNYKLLKLFLKNVFH